MKIRPVGAEFHAKRRKTTKLIVTFRNFADTRVNTGCYFEGATNQGTYTMAFENWHCVLSCDVTRVPKLL